MSTFYQPGLYECEIVGQGMTESSNGNPAFFLKFNVVAYQDPKDKEFYAVDVSYERTWYQSITHGTIDFLLPKLERLGFNQTKLSQLDPNSRDAFLFGGSADMYCRHEEYPKGSGKWNERWDVAKIPLESKKMKELDALFGAKVKQFFGNGQRVEKAEKLSVPKGDEIPAPPVDDDDIPF